MKREEEWWNQLHRTDVRESRLSLISLRILILQRNYIRVLGIGLLFIRSKQKKRGS